jgi:hypothetical protein
VKFTLSGLPSTDSSGRWFAGAVSVALVFGAVRLRAPADVGRGRTSGAAAVSGQTVAEERDRLVATREALYGELVALERAARAMDSPCPSDQRRQLVTRLEEVYQDIAALDKPRAA